MSGPWPGIELLGTMVPGTIGPGSIVGAVGEMVGGTLAGTAIGEASASASAAPTASFVLGWAASEACDLRGRPRPGPGLLVMGFKVGSARLALSE